MSGNSPIITPDPPSIPEGRRVYAIGDVHGRMDLLDRLIRMIGDDDTRRPQLETEIILLGDLVDRGPDSAGVVARAMTGSAGFAPLHTLMGNHEEQLVDSVAGDGEMISAWLFYGGRERSEEHTSELQSLMRISYAVFCLKKNKDIIIQEEKQKTQ